MAHLDVIIGKERGSNEYCFLVAPPFSIRGTENVSTLGGHVYEVIFFDQYCEEKSPLFEALKIILGAPMMITARICTEPVKWEMLEKGGNDEQSSGDPSGSDDSRSGDD